MGKKSLHITSTSTGDTLEIGRAISELLAPGDILGFTGELGAGKTVMIRGICQGLEVKENVTSSSFVLMRPLTGLMPVYHFDLYRLNGPDELEDLGCHEYLYSDGISMLEWCDRLGEFQDPHFLEIAIHYDADYRDTREITLTTAGVRFLPLLESLHDSLTAAGYTTCRNPE
jgi:tRNA threonylcarbamoyladenosine biosynthesis protein TsaE